MVLGGCELCQSAERVEPIRERTSVQSKPAARHLPSTCPGPAWTASPLVAFVQLLRSGSRHRALGKSPDTTTCHGENRRTLSGLGWRQPLSRTVHLCDRETPARSPVQHLGDGSPLLPDPRPAAGRAPENSWFRGVIGARRPVSDRRIPRQHRPDGYRRARRASHERSRNVRRIADVQPGSTVNCTSRPAVLCSRWSTFKSATRWEGVCAAPVFVLAAPARPADQREPS